MSDEQLFQLLAVTDPGAALIQFRGEVMASIDEIKAKLAQIDADLTAYREHQQADELAEGEQETRLTALAGTVTDLTGVVADLADKVDKLINPP